MEAPKTLPVIDDNGEEHILEVLYTVENDAKDRFFAMLVDPDSDSGEVYPYEYFEDGNMIFVTDEKDLDMLAEVLAAYQAEEF